MSDDEIFRVLDPDPPNRGDNEVTEQDANFVQVIRSAVVETRLLSKNPAKTKLICRTEEEIKKSFDADVDSETEEGPEVHKVTSPQPVTTGKSKSTLQFI